MPFQKFILLEENTDKKDNFRDFSDSERNYAKAPRQKTKKLNKPSFLSKYKIPIVIAIVRTTDYGVYQ